MHRMVWANPTDETCRGGLTREALGLSEMSHFILAKTSSCTLRCLTLSVQCCKNTCNQTRVLTISMFLHATVAVTLWAGLT